MRRQIEVTIGIVSVVIFMFCIPQEGFGFFEGRAGLFNNGGGDRLPILGPPNDGCYVPQHAILTGEWNNEIGNGASVVKHGI